MIISTGNLCCCRPTSLRIRIKPLKDPGWSSSCFCLQTHILSFSTSQCPKWAAFYELANQEIVTRIKNKNFKTVCSVTSVVSDSLQFFATLWSVARQAPLSTGFSRQEHWSGLPCPPPGIFLTQEWNPLLVSLPFWQVGSLPLSTTWEAQSEAAHLCPAVCDPTDCSPPACSVNGSHQARTLEWVAMPS